MENWVNSIHSACAAAFARHRGKTGTLHLLQEEIYRLEKAIESVSAERNFILLPEFSLSFLLQKKNFFFAVLSSTILCVHNVHVRNH